MTRSAFAAVILLTTIRAFAQTDVYERGLAFASKGDNAQCIATLTPFTEKASRLQVPAMAVVANCLDNSGQAEKAIKMYRRALTIAPGYAAVSYDLAVALTRQKKYDEARALLEELTEKNPSHASAQFLLARIFKEQKQTVPAMFAYLHFLALEPGSVRSPQAIVNLLELLNYAVDPKAPGKGTDFEKLEQRIESVIVRYVESSQGKRDYTARGQRPFFAAMMREHLIAPFVCTSLATATIKGSREWTEAHVGELDRYVKWIEPQLAHKPKPGASP
jgi:tetratricopeptide (TPR) repeat protein